MLIPVLRDRTTKPPLGTPLRSDGHWSVQRLVGAWAFNEGAGRVAFDASSQNNGTIVATPYAPAGLKFTRSTGEGVTTRHNINLTGNTPCTVVTQINTTFNTSNVNAHFLNIGQYTTNNAIALIIQNGYIKFGPWAANHISFGKYNDGKDHIVAYVYNGASSSLIVDGRMDRQYAFSSLNLLNAPMYIGQYGGGTSFEFSGLIGFTLLYSRALSPIEIASTSANPWQIYEPEIVWVEVGGSGVTAITAALAIAQPAQTQATTGKLVFSGSSTTSQQPQTCALSALLSFRASTAEMQAANLQAIVASLSFSGSINQIQQAQQQAIYQALTAITGTVSQTQAAQISALTASLIFGGANEQTQTVQASALAAVLRFTGATEQAQAAQEQAIVAILGEVAITGTVRQAQAIQLATLSASLKFSASVDQSQAAQTQILREFISAIITGYGIPVSVAMPQPLRVSAPLPQHTSISVALKLPPATVTAGLV